MTRKQLSSCQRELEAESKRVESELQSSEKSYIKSRKNVDNSDKLQFEHISFAESY